VSVKSPYSPQLLDVADAAEEEADVEVWFRLVEDGVVVLVGTGTVVYDGLMVVELKTCDAE
jgi:hypothetical protein